MKKQLFIFMTMLLPMVANADTWDGASSETSWFNDSESTFHLTKASQLKGLSDLVNTGQTFEGKTIYLDDDIDLCNYKWEPIGSNGSFKGNFDGNKKQIKNLYLANNRDSDFGKGLGLFGRADNAYIANLSIQGKIDCYRASVAGGVAGYALNCSISNIICNVDVESVKGENVFYGGTLGLVVGSGTGTRMSKIYSDGKITITSPSITHGLVGGIAGMVTSISESCSKAKIDITHSSGGSGSLYVGGMAGEVFSYIENAIFTGSIVVNNNGGDYCLTRGICFSDNEIRNVISAPSNFYSYADASQTALIDKNSNINNSYYTTTFANSYEKGIAITEDYLKSGVQLEGFGTDIWKFKSGEYPSLRAFSNELEDDKIDEYGRIDGVYYKLWPDGHEASVIAGSIKYSGDVVIKESIVSGGVKYIVTDISKNAFLSCTDLTSVIIPDSVLSIRDFAFWGCKNLTNISIGGSVRTIGNGAFYNCVKLASLELPKSLTRLESAFGNCTSLTSVSIPQNVSTIGENPFSGCDGLSSIIVENENVNFSSPNNCNAIISKKGYLISGCKTTTIPETVTVIARSAFSNITSLTDISIPNSVETIGAFAFENCTDLSSVTIPNSVTVIGADAFSGCQSLSSVNLGENVQEIYTGAFEKCNSLSDIIIPNSVTKIKSLAFSGCSSLASIKIGNNTHEIGDYAFGHCSSLATIIIPKSVKSIGRNILINCKSLSSVIVEDGNPAYDSRGNCNAIISTAENSLISGCKNTIIPNGITTIKYGAFSGCDGLNSIILPTSISIVEEYCFSNCEKLSSIAIPENINRIGQYAFSGCKNLKELYCCAEKIPEFVSTPFIDDTLMVKAILYVPNQSVELYRANSQWNKFKEIRPLSDHPFTLRYFIDGEEYKTSEYVYGTFVKPEPVPNKEGYTFSGWSEIPETMPAHDVTVSGSFIVNKYQITYIIDGEVYSSEYVEFGATIVPPTVENKEGYIFSGWSDVPDTMPAHDITIYGVFTSGIKEIMMSAYGDVRIYSPNGKRIDKLQKGLNIVILVDGTIKKVVVK